MNELIFSSRFLQIVFVLATAPLWWRVVKILWQELQLAGEEPAPQAWQGGKPRSTAIPLRRRTIDFGSARHTGSSLWELSEDETWSRRRLVNPSWDTGRSGRPRGARQRGAELTPRIVENASREDIGGFGRRSA